MWNKKILRYGMCGGSIQKKFLNTALLRKSIFYYNLAKALGKEDVEFFSGEELFYPR